MRRWIATAIGLIGVHDHPAAGLQRVPSPPRSSRSSRRSAGPAADHDAHDERPRSRAHHDGVFGAHGRCDPLRDGAVRLGDADLDRIGLGIVIGVASTVGQWIIVLAYRYGDASVLAPFSYTQLLWVSILGFFLFGEVPDVWTVTAPPSSSPAVSTSPIASASAAPSCWCWKSVPRTPDASSRVPLRAINGSNTTGGAGCALRFSGTVRLSSTGWPSRSRARARCWSRRWPAASAAPTCTRCSTPTAVRRDWRRRRGSACTMDLVARRRHGPRVLRRDRRARPGHRAQAQARAPASARCRRC